MPEPDQQKLNAQFREGIEKISKMEQQHAQEVKDLKQHIVQTAVKLEEQKAQIIHHENRLNISDETILSLKKRESEYKEKIKANQKEIQQKDDLIKGYEEQISEHTEELTKLEKSSQKSTRTFEAEIARLKDELKITQERLEQARKDKDAAEQTQKDLWDENTGLKERCEYLTNKASDRDFLANELQGEKEEHNETRKQFEAMKQEHTRWTDVIGDPSCRHPLLPPVDTTAPPSPPLPTLATELGQATGSDHEDGTDKETHSGSSVDNQTSLATELENSITRIVTPRSTQTTIPKLRVSKILEVHDQEPVDMPLPMPQEVVRIEYVDKVVEKIVEKLVYRDVAVEKKHDHSSFECFTKVYVDLSCLFLLWIVDKSGFVVKLMRKMTGSKAATKPITKKDAGEYVLELINPTQTKPDAEFEIEITNPADQCTTTATATEKAAIDTKKSRAVSKIPTPSQMSDYFNNLIITARARQISTKHTLISFFFHCLWYCALLSMLFWAYTFLVQRNDYLHANRTVCLRHPTSLLLGKKYFKVMREWAMELLYPDGDPLKDLPGMAPPPCYY